MAPQTARPAKVVRKGSPWRSLTSRDGRGTIQRTTCRSRLEAPSVPTQLVGPLGVGGMGEVYRARDTRLNREVALKLLPSAFSADPDRLARFAREAQTLALLNHAQHRADLRPRGDRHGAGARDGAGRRGNACGSDCAYRPAGYSTGGSPVHRPPDRRRGRGRSRPRNCPPRSEAGQRQDSARRDGQGPRLRTGESAATRRRTGPCEFADVHRPGPPRPA